MSVFDEATAVRPAGPGRYQVRPDERFAIVAPGGATPSAVNGGVMVATVLRAVLDTSPHPYPVATSAHFLRVPAARARRGRGDLAEAGQDGGDGTCRAGPGRADRFST